MATNNLGDDPSVDPEDNPLFDPEEAYVEGRKPATDEDFAEDARDGRAPSHAWVSIPKGGGMHRIPDDDLPTRR